MRTVDVEASATTTVADYAEGRRAATWAAETPPPKLQRPSARRTATQFCHQSLPRLHKPPPPPPLKPPPKTAAFAGRRGLLTAFRRHAVATLRDHPRERGIINVAGD